MTRPSFVRRIRANAAHLLALVRGVEDREYRPLDAEWHNILQAIEFGLDHEEALAETAELWQALIGFIESRGYFGTWQAVTWKVAAKIPLLPPELACRVANEAGFFFQKVNDPSRSLEMHAAALKSAGEAGNRFERALAILGNGNARVALRLYDQAETDIREALEILDELDEGRLHHASGVELLGLIASNRGDYPEAERLLSQSAKGYLEAGHHRKAANAFYNLGFTQDLAGKYREAIETLEAALKLLKPGIDRIAWANVYLAMGTSYFHLRDYPRAKKTFQAIDLQFLEKHGLLEQLMWTTNNLGNVALKELEWKLAWDYLSYSIRLARTLGNGISLGNSLGDLAEALLNLGKRDAARSALDEAIEALENYPENDWARKRLAAILAQRRDAFG
ncbi:MAG TPA: tetratricopeptide repeat protein [Anaerolineales bacterium]|nr:tetratricopeptide repeat protein [Anaerolineales bacterium]